MNNQNDKDNTQKKKKMTMWKVFALFILAIQVIMSAGVFLVVVKLNMLPNSYLIAIAFLLLLLFFLSDVLLVLSKKKRNKTKTSLYVKRALGVLLSGCTILVSLTGINTLSKLMATLDGVSSDTIIVKEKTAVYVMADDPAQNINDASGYTFGYTSTYDHDNTLKAIEKVEDELGQQINQQDFDTVVDMVEALYAGNVGAIFLNESYIDILEDMDEFANFSTDTRAIIVNEVDVIQKVTDSVSDITKEPFIVYLSGSDTRNTTLSSKTRSDVNILAVVNPQTKQILLVNTPRDYYIDISVSGYTQKDKLTHCGIYGIDCSMDTLGHLYGIDVNYYLKINFTGFETLIDAIGGIDIDVDKSFTSVDGYQYTKGETHMNGKYALNYVRERHAFGDGDFARGRHQMQMIKALVAKLTSGAIITNYSDIMSSLEGMFATDVTTTEMGDLVKMQLSDGGTWNVQTFAMDGEGKKRTTYSMPKTKAYVMEPNFDYVEYAKQLIQKVMDGETLTEDDMKFKKAE
ncbi:MAG: LCP family protein [Agathobacter sp.]|nr:LCP family protein [Agathobacter sp.]